MEGEEDSTVVATYVFRGIEYVVTMNVMSSRTTLVVEVEDRLTADQWRGSFDAAYIEDLTHKTGNYKQFPIFVSMLESGLTQSSDAVSLDLLTYSDLESLRNRKAGTGTRVIPGANKASLNSKRYLILTYTVEFDRIHYPLPLPYMGKPDPRALQETIRQLRNDLKASKQTTSKDYRLRELDQLRHDYDRLIAEKEDLEEELVNYKRQISCTTVGSAAKEIRMLKSMVKSLEEELVSEKTKYQRQSSKRNLENRHLQDEVEDLRASERNLKARVKSLTNELAMYKRTSTGRSGGSSYLRSNSARSSRENSFSSQKSNLSRERSRLNRQSSFERDRSRERSLDRLSSRSLQRGRNSSVERQRNSSLERRRNSSVDRHRSSSLDRSAGSRASRDRSLERSRDGSIRGQNRSRSSSTGSYRAASPSCAGGRYPRFDPTSYVKEKQRKMKEADLKQKRQARPRLPAGNQKKLRPSPLSDRNNAVGRRRPGSRSSSVGSIRSRTSSIESLSDIAASSDISQGRRRYGVEGGKNQHYKPGRNSNGKEPLTRKIRKPMESSNGMMSSPDSSYSRNLPGPKTKVNAPLASTPDSQTTRTRSRLVLEKENKVPKQGQDYFDRSAEINEIDERLNRLQEFMKTTLAQ